MSWTDTIRQNGWFSEASAEKNINHWEGKADKADAKEILKDTYIKKVTLGESGHKGDLACIAYMKVTSKDGTETWYKLTAYEQDLKTTAQMVKTLRGLAIQLPQDQLERWYSNGTEFRIADLPGEQTNMLGLLRYDPEQKQWMGISSKDRWGIQPTISPLNKDPFYYFSCRFDDLARGEYNKGSAGGPWDKWKSWKKAKPVWGEVKFWPVDAAGRAVEVSKNNLQSYYRYMRDGGPVKGTALAIVSPVVIPVYAALQSLYKTGQVVAWGGYKGAFLLTNIANFYTRGQMQPMIKKFGAQIGVYLYTHEDDIDKMVKVMEKIHESDENGEFTRLWLGSRDQPEREPRLVFEETNSQ